MNVYKQGYIEVININKKYLGIDIDECEFIGKGREGRVYKTKDNYAIKLFKSKKKCLDEYNILKKMESSKYFPKVIKRKGKYLLREYVYGVPLKDYIIENGMTREVTYNLVCLIEEFKKNGFKRLDMSSRHIYIQENCDLKVIDPRKCYIKQVTFPKILLRELEEGKALDDFIKGVMEIRPELANDWIKKLNAR